MPSGLSKDFNLGNSLSCSIFITLFILVNLSVFPVKAQLKDNDGLGNSRISFLNEKDTLAKDTSTIQEMNRKARITMLKSVIVPGWGQIENGHWWKVPIIYAGFGVVTGIEMFNQKRYVKYRTAYNLRTDGDSTTLDIFDPDNPNAVGYISSVNTLKSLREDYRRNRDLTIIIGGLIYLANVLDAYVYAQLKDFDISNDLSLHLNTPKLYNIADQYGITVGLSLSFK